jgi:hypothetical protein
MSLDSDADALMERMLDAISPLMRAGDSYIFVLRTREGIVISQTTASRDTSNRMLLELKRRAALALDS